MPPSRTRVEREDPTPRRKSCYACVKAKRRCDQRQPICARCSQRKVQCLYPTRPGLSESDPADPSPARSTILGSNPLLNSAGVDEAIIDLLVPSCHVETVDLPWISRKSPCLHHPELPWTPAEALDTPPEAADATSLGLAIHDRDIFGDASLDAELFFDLTDSAPTGKEIGGRPPTAVPAAPRRLDLARLHAALETNFSYAMDRIKAAPSTMLLENQTPWCHPLLYRENMPREMQGKDRQRHTHSQ